MIVVFDVLDGVLMYFDYVLFFVLGIVYFVDDLFVLLVVQYYELWFWEDQNIDFIY